MLRLSKNEHWALGTVSRGFNLWHVNGRRTAQLKLPPTVRNVSKGPGLSSVILLSARDEYAVAGIRKELYIWAMDSCQLVKVLAAHFQRIIDMQSLVVGRENSMITSSIDKSIKVWDLNYIFENDHHIDKHELTIDSVSVSTTVGLAVTVTRSCVGVWDYMTGRLLYTLAHSALGAIVTHALISEAGQHVAAVESGELLVWELTNRSVVSQERIASVTHMKFNKKQEQIMVVSSSGTLGNYTGLINIRGFPGGEELLHLEFPYKKLIDVVWTADEQMVIAYGWEKQKPTLFLFSAVDGAVLDRVLVKYPNMKDAKRLVSIPGRAGTVALVDPAQAALMDVATRRFLRTIPGWDGQCSSDGRFGLFAPPSGGMDLLDLRNGSIVRTLIPKVAEGIFDVIAIFNATNEYVLYYHSGRKTIRAFRRRDGVQIANYRVQADLRGMGTTGDGRCVVLGMGDGSLTTLAIADPAHPGTMAYLASLPSRCMDRRESEPEGQYLQNGAHYPNPHDYSIYTDYLKALYEVIPGNEPHPVVQS